MWSAGSSPGVSGVSPGVSGFPSGTAGSSSGSSSSISTGTICPIFAKGFFSDESMKIGGEDYCFISEKVPSVFMIVGPSDGTPRTQFPVHNPYFYLDETVIEKGSAAFASIAMDYLNGKYSE